MSTETTVAHTPGPWTADGKGCRLAGVGDVVNADCVSLVEISATSRPSHYDLSPEERDANTRLIAAAPDLLTACQAALNDRMYNDWPEVADLLIAAIAKAEEIYSDQDLPNRGELIEDDEPEPDREPEPDYDYVKHEDTASYRDQMKDAGRGHLVRW